MTRGEASNPLVQKVQGPYSPFGLAKQLVSTLSGPWAWALVGFCKMLAWSWAVTAVVVPGLIGLTGYPDKSIFKGVPGPTGVLQLSP